MTGENKERTETRECKRREKRPGFANARRHLKGAGEGAKEQRNNSGIRTEGKDCEQMFPPSRKNSGKENDGMINRE